MTTSRPSGTGRTRSIRAGTATAAALAVMGVFPTGADAGLQAADVTVSLVGQTWWVPASEDASIVVRLDADGLPDPPRRPLDAVGPVSPYEIVVVAQPAVDDRAGVAAAIEAASTGAPLTPVDAVRIPYDQVELRRGELVVTVPVEIRRNEDGDLRLAEDGLYPVVVTVTRDDAPIAQVHTFVERLPTGVLASEPSELGTVDLAVVGQVDGPPSLLPNGATRTDPATVAEVTRVAAAMRSLPGVPMTLALRPEVLEGLDRSREIADRTLLTALADAVGQRDVIAQTYVSVEPSSMVAAGLAERYVGQLRRGEDVIDDALPDAVSSRTIALVGDPLTGEGGDLLRDLGVRSLVLTGAGRDAISGAGFADPTLTLAVALPSGGTLPALTVDPTLSARLGEPGVDPGVQAARLMADMSAWLTEIADRGGRYDGRTIVLTAADGRLPEARTLAALADLVDGDPRMSWQSLGAAAIGTDPNVIDGEPAVFAPATAPATDEGDLAYTIGITDAERSHVGSMLPDGDPRHTRWVDLMDVAPSLALDGAGRSAYIDTVVAETGAVRASVSAPPRTTFTLGGRTGDITLSIGNTSAVELTVIIRVTSPKLLFPEGPQSVVLAPEATTIVRVPVEARSNNTFPVTVEILTPEGLTAVSPPVQLTARVTAFTGLGQLATGAAAIILLTWWTRHLRTNRRRRREAALAVAPTAHPSSGPTTPT